MGEQAAWLVFVGWLLCNGIAFIMAGLIAVAISNFIWISILGLILIVKKYKNGHRFRKKISVKFIK